MLQWPNSLIYSCIQFCWPPFENSIHSTLNADDRDSKKKNYVSLWIRRRESHVDDGFFLFLFSICTYPNSNAHVIRKSVIEFFFWSIPRPNILIGLSNIYIKLCAYENKPSVNIENVCKLYIYWYMSNDARQK